jgi:hypothetical protein
MEKPDNCPLCFGKWVLTKTVSSYEENFDCENCNIKLLMINNSVFLEKHFENTSYICWSKDCVEYIKDSGQFIILNFVPKYTITLEQLKKLFIFS